MPRYCFSTAHPCCHATRYLPSRAYAKFPVETGYRNGNHLGFGIELELVLQAKPNRLAELEAHRYKDLQLQVVRNRQAIKKYFESQLVAAQLLCQIRTNGTNKDYTMWGVEHDPSWKPGVGCCATTPLNPWQNIVLTFLLDGVEIFSPVLFEDWQTKITSVFDVIERAFTTVQNESAGTHVHVAPVGRNWTLAEIRQISKGVIAWAAPLRELMDRNRGTYAVWNDWDGSVDALALNDLVNSMSPNRYCAWNFRPLVDSRGTIEFRRPYQTLSVRDANHWVTATLCLFATFTRNGGLNAPLAETKVISNRLAAEAKKLRLENCLDCRVFT
ncbi:hypothetical protein BDW02DRAFT_581773 [Decorospora gaudefroyi]|uniref:Amidoligase enzyme n=1 Tax=Decorospora gaudefroyi TaxID=184978 RepID=A0A6A5K3K0_9PLEO|nr:hypothetical protein BDW02DRAFT_581773 [Decorospora gaudefroyi]